MVYLDLISLIAPNKTYEYKFKVRQNGTYWYHSHSKGQEQDGLYGAFVIYPKDKTPLTAAEKTDKDYVVLLSDFHNSTSDQIMKNLKKKLTTIRTAAKQYSMY
jgi:FtsP/CotA-like multicopper oxidase with cupredoxin domain